MNVLLYFVRPSERTLRARLHLNDDLLQLLRSPWNGQVMIDIEAELEPVSGLVGQVFFGPVGVSLQVETCLDGVFRGVMRIGNGRRHNLPDAHFMLDPTWSDLTAAILDLCAFAA